MITTKPEFNYEQSWALKVASVDAKESQRIRQTLELIPDEVRSVLDAGCGDGRVTMALARGHDVVGVDVSCNALNREARRSRVASVLTALPFRDESFDLVLVSEVIEHIPADVLPQVLQELRRTAKKYVLITVPYRETLEDASVRCQCGFVFHKWGHLKRYDERALVSLYQDMTACAVRLLGPSKPADPGWLKRIGQSWGGRHAVPDADTICPRCCGRLFETSAVNWVSTVCYYSGSDRRTRFATPSRDLGRRAFSEASRSIRFRALVC